MNKHIVLGIAFLLPLLDAPIFPQSNDQASSPQKATAPSQESLPKLPDSPFPQQKFVLPPNREAGAMPEQRMQLETDRQYELAELIDIAERENPETRIAWERARNAAIGKGIAASTYLPVITANVLGAYQGANGQNSSSGVTVQSSGNVFGSVEAVSLQWLLFDFGGRKNIVDAARKLSDVSNIGFTAANQQVIYAVSVAYYAYVAAVQRGKTASEALANSKEIESATAARYRHGEGTVVETSQAGYSTAQAHFSVVNTQGSEQQAYAALLTAMGVSPLIKIRIAPVHNIRCPKTT